MWSIPLLRSGIFGFFLLLLIQTWIVSGVIVPLRIAGCSMFPVFQGEHLQFLCPECGNRFVINDVVDQKRSHWCICPSCRFAEVPTVSGISMPGNRIFYEKSLICFLPLKRWDVVLFRHPENPSEYVIKRVIALPGETVTLHNGSIWIDGKICHRPFAVQQQMRIPLQYGEWEKQENTLCFVPKRKTSHFHPMFLQEMPNTKAPVFYGITNECSANQWYLHRSESTFRTEDLILELDWKNEANKMFEIMVLRSSGDYRITFSTEGKMRRFQCFFNDEKQEEKICSNDVFSRNTSAKVNLSTLDQQLLLTVNGNTIFCIPMDNDSTKTREKPDVLFKIQGDSAENLKLFQGVYYTDNPDRFFDDAKSEKYVVPDGYLFVLGDNSRFSEDSRTWNNSFVPIRNLIGRVIIYF